MQSGEPAPKKHKKHKKDKDRDRERYDDFGETSHSSSGQVTPISTNARLKLILRVGGSSTPEHSDSPASGPSHILNVPYDEDSRHSAASLSLSHSHSHSHIKKGKKKEKKRKKEKKHKHHNKEKRREKREKEEAALLHQIASPTIVPISVPMEVDKVVEETAVISPKITSESEKAELPSLPKLPEDETSQPVIPSDILKEIPQPVAPTVKRPLDNKRLQKLLEYLSRALEKKDPQQFFAWPVTDKIAPGYSSIISNPMDFSTMKSKVDRAEYSTLAEFTDDFKLMCENAMIYNQCETIYYKAAKKLLQGGLKLLDPEKIRSLLPLIPSIRMLQEEQLGFQLLPDQPTTDGCDVMSLSDEDSQENFCSDPTQSIHYVPPHPNDPADLCGAFTDDLTTEEVLHQARMAARDAAHRLATKKPNRKMGFLRQRPDGSTSLAILVPSSGNTPGDEVPVSLGALSGKVQHGNIQLQGAKEDRKNFQRPAKPLNYGAFSSFAPTRDSSFAGLNDDETSLVLSTYGDEESKNYAESLRDFTRGCDYTMRMVDDILDTLTHGQHSKTINVIEERRRMEAEVAEFKRREEEYAKCIAEESNYLEKMGFPSALPLNSQPSEGTAKDQKPAEISDINFESLSSLNELGIEVGFLDELKQTVDSSTDKKLSETVQLLGDLRDAQNERFSRPLLPMAPYALPPSEKEMQIANRVTENLVDLAKEANPASVSTVSSLHKAMGVDINAFDYKPSLDAVKVEAQDSPVQPAETSEIASAAGASASITEPGVVTQTQGVTGTEQPSATFEDVKVEPMETGAT